MNNLKIGKTQMLHRIIELIAHEIGHNLRGHQFFDLGPHYINKAK